MRLRQLVLVFFALGALACGPTEAVGARSVTILGAGVVNNPGNRSLRFDILEFGLERFCFEMNRRGAPLKMADDQPVLGRFFADRCQSQVLDRGERQSFIVQYAGKGYAWTNISHRIGFTAAGLVEYAPDFQVHDGAMYVYFRPLRIDSANFEALMVESKLTQAGAAAAGVDINQLGRDIITAQLKRGFTVIRYNEKGETDFGLGLIPKGEEPFKPFQVRGSDKIALDNDRTEVHVGQQDFLGGYELTDDDQALYLTALLQGAPAVDAFAVPAGIARAMIDRYIRQPGPAPLTVHPLLDEVIQRGQTHKRFIAPPEGSYFLVIDHSAGVGQTNPPPNGPPARVDYLVQLGEEP